MARPALSRPALRHENLHRDRTALLQEDTVRNPQRSISAALAAVRHSPAATHICFPGEDGGQSLSDMAQRDLDAALQLLADRAQYITGANGAAIALRRAHGDDLLCRASIGSNAPELGALLSTEFGLSGESVRTRRTLRCDDAERDDRVNRQVCRELRIASVVVMPVVHDDEVLGVFELFSEKAHAFGPRDLVALERLSEMVDTAVRLARAAEELPERIRSVDTIEESKSSVVAESSIFDIETQVEIAKVPDSAAGVTVPQPGPVLTPESFISEPIAADTSEPKAAAKVATPVPAKPPKRALLWSAPEQIAIEDRDSLTSDGVPPVLRDLRKCQACGFPISAGRLLCVECEEKRWRGDLKPASSSASARAFAAAQSAGAPLSRAGLRPVPAELLPAINVSKAVAIEAEPPDEVHETKLSDTVTRMPGFLSGAMQPSQSWFSSNKYILGAILLVTSVIAAVFLLR